MNQTNPQASRPGRVVTGTILSTFGEATETVYSHYATMPKEVVGLVEQLASVEFPVNSKQDLVERLGGAEVPVFVGDNVVEAGAAAMFLPAAMFPLASRENLAEKLAEYYARRSQVPREEPLPPAMVDRLASRFVIENPGLLQAVARAVRSLLAIAEAGDGDDLKSAERFLRDNPALAATVADAFRGVGRLRADTAEEADEEQTPTADEPTEEPPPTGGSGN